MEQRTFDELISNFNSTISKWEIDLKYKFELLGMIANIGYEHEKMLNNLPSAEPNVPDTNVGDTISRQAAIDVIKHVEVHFTVKSTVDFSAHKKAVHKIIDHILEAQEKALGELPSAEKTGKWILCQDEYGDSWICSECGEEYVLYDSAIAEQHYCPNCGSHNTV